MRLNKILYLGHNLDKKCIKDRIIRAETKTVIKRI